MLNVANNVEVFFTRRRLFAASKAGVRQGKRILAVGWSTEEMENTLVAASKEVVPILEENQRKLWLYGDRFYWADSDLSKEDIYALIRAKERRTEKALANAHLQMQVEESGKRSRAVIPREVREAVFIRDEGKCVDCGSRFEIQYDHILPFSRGGSNSESNICLRCGDCNRRKSDSL